MAGSNDKQINSWMETERAEDVFVYAGTELAEEDSLDTSANNVGQESTITRGFLLAGKKENYFVSNVPLNRRGAQAMIYQCKGETGGKDYALKLYFENMINMPKLVGVLTKLEQAKNVTKVIEHGQCEIDGEKYYYAVMPKYEPLPREEYVYAKSHSKPGYEQMVLDLIRQINDALKSVHNQGIWHGDIKPDNIMWDAENKHAVLIDFGGSTGTDNVGRTMMAAATTGAYLPGEATGNHKLNKHVDYYSLGMTFAELLNGAYPKREDQVRRIAGEVDAIGYCFIPKSLPEHYKNLLRGMLYESNNPDLRKEHRWTGDNLDTWLGYMYDKKYEQASRYKNVNATSQSDVQKPVVSPQKQKPTANPKNVLQFKQPLLLKVNGQVQTLHSLNELADALCEDWEEGKAILRNPSLFDRGKMGADIHGILMEDIKKINGAQNDVGNASADIEYFKFLYSYITDKKTFHWGALPGVKDKNAFALRLQAVFATLDKKNYKLSKWWTDKNDANRAKSSVFAEIFANGIFSAYLKASGELDQNLISQCRKVEEIFSKKKETLSLKEAMEVYTMIYMILGIKTYQMPAGKEYKSYRDFAQDMKESLKSQGGKGVEALWESVTKGDSYRPEFYAWVRVNEPQYAKKMDFRVNI